MIEVDWSRFTVEAVRCFRSLNPPRWPGFVIQNVKLVEIYLEFIS
jgi:hypothetical protein